MQFKTLIISLLIIFFNISVNAKPPELTPHLTCKKTEEILQAHVNYKEFTPEIARRTLHNFIEELDPSKTYFIQSEVEAWENPSEELIDAIIHDYNKETFTHFETLYKTMLQAIKRRERIEQSLINANSAPNTKAFDLKQLQRAQSEQELEALLLQIRALQLETAEKLELESQDQFLQRIAKRRNNREQELIQNGKEKDQKKQLLAYFLKSFSASLDNHTVYFTPTEANQFMIQVQQRLFGIGAQLRDDLNGFTLVRLLEGGPALREGQLKSGDKIIAVNQEPVVGMDIIEAVDLIRGPKGTPVGLTILRETGEGAQKRHEKFNLEVVRDEIVLKETRFESHTVPFGDGVIAHIRLFSFYQDPSDSSASDITQALEAIKTTHKLHGVVLDLRNNAGGLLPQAVAVTGLFIKKGVVVSIKDSTGSIQHLRNFNADLTWDGPLLVLTNKGSASAAEIVAQTLQDYGRALVVGDPYTWGKGSYQTFTLEAGNVNKINPQGEYKVTRGLYYTVSGKSPQLTGTKADIEIPGSLTQIEVGESYSKFPLDNDEIPPNFNDTLLDVHPFHRGKMMRIYKKDLQKKIDLYTPYLERLKENSDQRIADNTNYQNFLTEIRKEEFDPESIETYGHNDLQLEESLNIMKDLVLLNMHTPENKIKQPQ